MVPIILDHDIGTNPDDFFELLLLLSRAPERLKLLVSGNRFPVERALMAAGVLKDLGFDPGMSLSGEETGCAEFYAPETLSKELPPPAADYIKTIRRIIERDGRTVYLCTQGLSNLARFAREYPELVGQLDVYHMGMNLNGYENWIKGGTNMEADPAAAKFIYGTLRNLTVVGAHTTTQEGLRVNPGTLLYRIVSGKGHPAFQKLAAHLENFHGRRGRYPCMHDPLTASAALGENFCQFQKVSVDFDHRGLYRKGSQMIVNISRTECDTGGFMEYLAKALEGLVG
jgi:inosine-uridine nucleoside N-ribohydrolase